MSVAEASAVATRHMGTCPVCEGSFKCRVGHRPGTPNDSTFVMVHHGYRRPGHGTIVGDCFGVDHEPYELSARGCRTYRGFIEGVIAERRAWLASLNARTPTELTDASRREVRTYHRDVPEEAAGYDALRLARISATTHELHALEDDRRRMSRLIEQWAPKPLIEWDEEREAARQAETRAERDKVREASRLAKAAEEERKRQKRADLDARRAAVLDDFRLQFRSIAQVTDVHQRTSQAQALATRLRLKKYNWIWLRELRLDEIFISLGLAENRGGYVSYRYPLPGG